MRKQIVFSLVCAVVMALGISSCQEKPQQIPMPVPATAYESTSFKLYPTENIWTFLKLDTRTGQLWQEHWSIDEKGSQVELVLSDAILAEGKTNGRFELYPTKNFYNFILLDKVSGSTYQVQWSFKEEQRGVIPISGQ